MLTTKYFKIFFKNEVAIRDLYSLDKYTMFFFKKERVYTKLKYSKVPQFDTASGAVASLFAGLFGFLVTEKFGFELIDSGDFYFVIMYSVFTVLVIRTAFKLNTLSLLSLPTFFSVVIKLQLSFFVKLLKKTITKLNVI